MNYMEKVLEDGKILLPIEHAIALSEALSIQGIGNWAFVVSDTHLLVELKIEEEN